jgi:excisionase family DNA binding protein
MLFNDLNETLPSVLTVRDFMDATRSSRSKTYRMIRCKQIPAVKVGKTILIPKAVVLKLLTPEMDKE